MMRVVRLVRLVKLFKHVDLQRKGSDAHATMRKSRLSRFTPTVKQSHVGQKLTELTTKRIVFGVLAMVLVLPFLDVSNTVYGQMPTLARRGLLALHDMALIDDNSEVFTSALEVRCCNYRHAHRCTILSMLLLQL